MEQLKIYSRAIKQDVSTNVSFIKILDYLSSALVVVVVVVSCLFS